MLTNKDIEELRQMEEHCLAVAERMARGENYFAVSLSSLISEMNHSTRQKLHKQQLQINENK